jgi:hypothetical protein
VEITSKKRQDQLKEFLFIILKVYSRDILQILKLHPLLDMFIIEIFLLNIKIDRKMQEYYLMHLQLDYAIKELDL